MIGLAAAALLAAGGLGQGPTRAAGITACLNGLDPNMTFDQLSPQRRRTLVACFNRLGAREMNARTPFRIDRFTTLESVSATGTVVLYNYRLDMDARSFTADQRAAVSRVARSSVCEEPSARLAMTLGASYAFIWRDRSGRAVHQMRVDRC